MNQSLRALALEAIAGSRAQEDPDYPLFHVAPPVGRLNDPNGLMVHQGVYHAFYQFSPFHGRRKLVYWGHSTSTDLTHWESQEPAIIPDSWYDINGAYSGNAISHNGTVHLFYTGNVRPSEQERDTHQCLVTSTDMVTFTKEPANPLIPSPPPGYTEHVRDPQVWRDDDGTFRMCLGAQRQDLTGCALLYRSPDLMSWEFEGELQFPDAAGLYDRFGYMWECPSLIRVPDVSGEKVHDVLVFCPQGITPQREGFKNIFPTCYVIGRLEGTSLVDTGDFYELDRGFEFYAPQAFAHEPGHGGPTLITGWVGNASEDDQPSMEHNWVHTLSVIRKLQVRDGRLVQTPILDTATATDLLTDQPQGLPGSVGPKDAVIPALHNSRSFALKFQVTPSAANPQNTDPEEASWHLRLGTSSRHVDFHFTGSTMTVDRSTTRYPHGNHRTVTLPAAASAPEMAPAGPPPSTLTVELLHDRSVTELFLDDGALSFTMRSYLDAEDFAVSLQSASGIHIDWLSAVSFTDD
ncbi:glycoside hydrolase family 32 protein [Kocuria sp.]|uniref:glycoside hydrolase family 32 protein n=1 Tax=Kocuria sp. TaxID=1871328 RepID=UPI0026E0CDE7|nr:glycoside hydrolase family 32 protein [Kocuria sp.]MDO5619046.1 glycoside hydrolase family 32 protein [Kocuria sp.]